MSFGSLPVVLLFAWAMVDGGFAASSADAQQTPVRRPNEHWAFRSIHRPAVPETKDASWPSTPVDRFILSRLEKEGIAPAASADRRTFLRRLYLDLIGLLPSPEEQSAFLADQSPSAFA